ncbi:MAG: aldolase/citrate lyase family protein [Burkholderiaceae bacterium]
MTDTALKRRLRAGETLYGCWLALGAPLAAEALSHAGFDFLVVDTEHAPIDGMNLVALLQAIGNGTAAPVVRVAENAAVRVKRAMDAGCATLVFPAVNSADEAARAVAAMRYPPAGVRGVAGSVRAARYGFDRDYLARANDDACAIVQIESAAALGAVDAIAAVDGVDVLFVGPADLAASLGHLGATAHADVQAAIDRIAVAARAHGRAAGIFATSVAQARDYAARGFALIALAADTTWLLQGASAALAQARA